ncbi:hypothetical protein C6501_06000 [Candidatus Poribacteria bacterium]|nr:MAG: hypothetical protein C6501_06000 [Candidatus Poribacteria bacterium]
MKPAVLVILLLFIFGITLLGCESTFFEGLNKFFDGLNTSLDDVKTDNYTGPQTVEALMKAFDARYTSQAANGKWATVREIKLGEKLKIEITLKDMDAEYPRNAWLEILINKGFKIEKFEDYDRLLNLRSKLMMQEFHQGENFHIAKDKHIDLLLLNHRIEHELISTAQQTDPEVNDWIVIGGKPLPSIPGRMYIQKTKTGFLIRSMISSITEGKNGEITSVIGPRLSDEQKTALLEKGLEPEGWEVVYIDEEGNIIPTDR